MHMHHYNCGGGCSAAGSRYAPEGDASGLADRSVAPISDDAGAVAGRQHGGCRQHVHERHDSQIQKLDMKFRRYRFKVSTSDQFAYRPVGRLGGRTAETALPHILGLIK